MSCCSGFQGDNKLRTAAPRWGERVLRSHKSSFSASVFQTLAPSPGPQRKKRLTKRVQLAINTKGTYYRRASTSCAAGLAFTTLPSKTVHQCICTRLPPEGPVTHNIGGDRASEGPAPDIASVGDGARRMPHRSPGRRPRAARPLGRPAAHVARAPAGAGRLPHGRRRLRAVAGASTRRQRGQRRRDARPRRARGRLAKYVTVPLRRVPRVGGPHGAAPARERRARAAPRGRRRDC